MSNILMTRAFDAQSNIINISDVVSGKACSCFCLDCGGSLSAKKGKILSHHFAHISELTNETICNWQPETEIHIIAKEIIARDKYLYIQIGTINPKTIKIVFEEVLSEQRDGNRIPDIIGFIAGEAINIEIAVTHFCDHMKITEMKRMNKNCLEIDLSGFHILGDTVTTENVRNELNTASSKWLSISPFGDISNRVHNHNRLEMQNLHKDFLLEKKKHQADIEDMKYKISKKIERNKALKRESEKLISETEIARNYLIKLKYDVPELENFIAQSKELINQLNDFKREKEEQIRWYANSKSTLAEERKINETKSAELLNVSEKQKKKEELLAKKDSELEFKSKKLDISMKKLDLAIEERSKEIAEHQFIALCKSKENEIKEIDTRVAKAKKEFLEVKRRLGSFVKMGHIAT
ncbi:hypothetical protein ERW49_19180 [Aliivibrio finisterrensis]|uniref:Competence protein n=1 Tax=Aliivibrio finisterrensis TaxID=511998 RepID=A0A4Q5K3X5_9GAMM|nr:hypothetical protein [Aliivibrio finisterrensis]RYU39453.1 hypothetical protein ERW49_19180 [Aliivibrio finisterrensis]